MDGTVKVVDLNGEDEWELDEFLNLGKVQESPADENAVIEPTVPSAAAPLPDTAAESLPSNLSESAAQVLTVQTPELEQNVGIDDNASQTSSELSDYFWTIDENNELLGGDHFNFANNAWNEKNKDAFSQEVEARSELKTIAAPTSTMALFIAESAKNKSLPEPVLSKLLAETHQRDSAGNIGSTPLSLNLNQR